MMMSVYQRLNELASELAGDGKSPNVYFVSAGSDVTTLTTDRRIAYQHWRAILAIRPKIAACLEDREHGILASAEPDEAGHMRLRTFDGYAELAAAIDQEDR